MRHPSSSTLGPVLAAAFAMAPVSLEARWVREATITMGDYFGFGDQQYGTNPIDVDFDGSSAFVTGWHNHGEAAPRSVGALVIHDVRSAAPTFVANPDTLYNALQYGGYISVTEVPGTDNFYICYDRSEETAFIGAHRKSDGALVAAFGTAGRAVSTDFDAALGGRIIGGIATDPGYVTGGETIGYPALSYLTFGKGRQGLLDPITGAGIYSVGSGMRIYVDSYGNSSYRSHTYDPSTGDLWVRVQNDIQWSERVAFDVMKGTDEFNSTNNGTIVLDLPNGPFRIGQYAEYIPASPEIPDSPLVAYNDRPDPSLGETGNDLRFIRPDGTADGLEQPFLDGSEDGGAPYTEEVGIFSSAYHRDPVTGEHVLVVLSFADNRLDVFVQGTGQLEPPVITSIRANDAGPGVVLEWTPAEGTFDIGRAAAPGQAFEAIATGITSPTYTDASPLAAAAFYQVIRTE